MMFKVHDDWKRSLNAQDEARLNEILKATAKHRAAYRGAHDVKVAQLWAAVLELSKMNNEASEKVKRMERVFDAITLAMNNEEIIEKHVCVCHCGKKDIKEALESY